MRDEPTVVPGDLADGGAHRARLDFFVSGHCNNDCVFCSEGGRSGFRRVYTLEDAREVLARAPGVETVFLTGGEPTLSPLLGDFAALARQAGARHIALITNGRRLSRPAFAQDLLDRGVNEIRVSVHGHRAALHDAHTGVTGSFAQVERALATLRELRANRPLHLIALVVVTRHNLPAIEDIYRWALAAGFDRVGFGVVRPSGRAAAEFEAVIPRYAAVAERFRAFLATLRYRRDPVNVDSVPPCLLPGQAGFIGSRMRLLSLGETGLVERDEFWEKSKGPPCAGCRLARSCEGVWSGYVEHYGWEEFPPVELPPWGPGDPPRCLHDRGGDGERAPLLALLAGCNNGCRAYCREVPRDPSDAPPSFAQLSERLERFARAGATQVRLGGEEPTLSPHLRPLLARADELGLAPTLCSNARRLAYPGFVRALSRHGRPSLHTALLGATPARHDALTRVAGSFQQSIDGVRNARAAGWPVTITIFDEGEGPALAELEALGCAVRRQRADPPDDQGA